MRVERPVERARRQRMPAHKAVVDFGHAIVGAAGPKARQRKDAAIAEGEQGRIPASIGHIGDPRPLERDRIEKPGAAQPMKRIILFRSASNEEPPVRQESLTRTKDVIWRERRDYERSIFTIPDDAAKIVSGKLCRIVSRTSKEQDCP